MNWVDLERWLSGHMRDYAAELAYRTALRIMLLSALQIEKTWQSQERYSLPILARLRVLITAHAHVHNRNPKADKLMIDALLAMEAIDSISGISKTIREMVLTITTADRLTRSSQLKKTIECAENTVRDLLEEHNTQWISLNVWDEVKQDTIKIEEDNQRYWSRTQILNDKKKYDKIWALLNSTLLFYDEAWKSILKWLDFRLFGESSGLDEYEWIKVEGAASRLPDDVWVNPKEINTQFWYLINYRGDARHIPATVKPKEHRPSMTPPVQRPSPLATAPQKDGESVRSPDIDGGGRVLKSAFRWLLNHPLRGIGHWHCIEHSSGLYLGVPLTPSRLWSGGIGIDVLIGE